jgi:hypothetical protein
MVLSTLTDHVPAPGTYAISAWLFLRCLGLIYFGAFVSLATQLKGLVGSQGILPAAELVVRSGEIEWKRVLRLPSLLWFDSTDTFLLTLGWGGALLSILLIVGVAPLPVSVLLWLSYLSLFNIGRGFLGYQWDVLLLETGFLAIFLAPLEILPNFPPRSCPSPVIIWLLWWLLFRLMFSSGFTKLSSGDPPWRKLTALKFHYETQPLPTPIAWWMHQLPGRVHAFCAAGALSIELFVPFLIFGPPGARLIAAMCFVGLMVAIELTGNYAFFNLLTVVLCIPLLDDRMWLQVLHGVLPSTETWSPAGPSAIGVWISLPVAALLVTLSAVPVSQLSYSLPRWPKPLDLLITFFTPFRLVNTYGLFSVMTTERPELIIEGSRDGEHWEEYEFKFKPGDIKRAPHFVAPHQPRVDWQMWFAALGFYQNHPWLGRFMTCLLQGSKPVERLLRVNPFPNGPPRHVRCVVYDYRFTTPAEREATGAWWRRERRGLYCPVMESASPLKKGSIA